LPPPARRSAARPSGRATSGLSPLRCPGAGWCLGFGLLISLLFLLFGYPFVDFISTSDAVRRQAREFLPLAALTPFIGAVAFTFDGVFIGATGPVPCGI
jgi:Na+-driven multidrug efflux pump